MSFQGHLAIVKSYRGHEVSLGHHSRNLDDNPNVPLLGHESEDEDILDIAEKVVCCVFLFFDEIMLLTVKQLKKMS